MPPLLWVLANNVDKTELKELLNIAMERQTNQEKWNALIVKVPEFAPWAHFGFTRLKRTLEHAQNVYFNKDKKLLPRRSQCHSS